MASKENSESCSPHRPRPFNEQLRDVLASLDEIALSEEEDAVDVESPTAAAASSADASPRARQPRLVLGANSRSDMLDRSTPLVDRSTRQSATPVLCTSLNRSSDERSAARSSPAAAVNSFAQGERRSTPPLSLSMARSPSFPASVRSPAELERSVSYTQSPSMHSPQAGNRREQQQLLSPPLNRDSTPLEPKKSIRRNLFDAAGELATNSANLKPRLVKATPIEGTVRIYSYTYSIFICL